MLRKLTESHVESVIRRVKGLTKEDSSGRRDVEMLVGHMDALKEENKKIREQSEMKAMAQVAEACLTMLKVELPQKLKDILAGK